MKEEITLADTFEKDEQLRREAEPESLSIKIQNTLYRNIKINQDEVWTYTFKLEYSYLRPDDILIYGHYQGRRVMLASTMPDYGLSTQEMFNQVKQPLFLVKEIPNGSRIEIDLYAEPWRYFSYFPLETKKWLCHIRISYVPKDLALDYRDTSGIKIDQPLVRWVKWLLGIY